MVGSHKEERGTNLINIEIESEERRYIMGHIEKLLAEVQLFCFEQGSQYNHFSPWDRIGNMIQSIRIPMIHYLNY